MNLKYIFLFFAVLLIGCREEKHDIDIISQGGINSDEARELHQNVDKNSYFEILSFLQDNEMIQSDGQKAILLIFGNNGCKYCDQLKKEIVQNTTLQNLIKNDFSSYYINISYKKEHFFNQEIFDTHMLRDYFSIRSTPTLIILNPRGELIFEIIGYMEEKKLQLALKYISENTNLTQEQITKNLYSLFIQESLL